MRTKSRPTLKSWRNGSSPRSPGWRDGDLVQVVGGPGEAPCWRPSPSRSASRGGDALVTLKTGRLFRRLIEDVPAKYDSKPPELERKLAELITARIVIESGDFDLAGVGLPAGRLQAATKATEAMDAVLLKRGVRQVGLGNGLYPTAARACANGVSEKELAASSGAVSMWTSKHCKRRRSASGKALAGAKELR